jgi:hypothetical protein
MARQNDRFDSNALKRAFTPPTVVRSFWVAVVVGSILNLINQGAEVAGGRSIDVLKLLLTYAVPFFVATFGAYSAYKAAGNVR